MRKRFTGKSGVDAGVVLLMLAMIAVPAAIALHSIKVPAILQLSSTNPTPYGYTWSVLLFVIPIAIIMLWFLASEHLKIPQRAFLRALLLLIPFGFGLDFSSLIDGFISIIRRRRLAYPRWQSEDLYPWRNTSSTFSGFVAVAVDLRLAERVLAQSLHCSGLCIPRQELTSVASVPSKLSC